MWIDIGLTAYRTLSLTHTHTHTTYCTSQTAHSHTTYAKTPHTHKHTLSHTLTTYHPDMKPSSTHRLIDVCVCVSGNTFFTHTHTAVCAGLIQDSVGQLS